METEEQDPNAALQSEEIVFSVSENFKQKVLKLLRALQIPKAILLEGNPGIGKGCLIEYIAQSINQTLIKIPINE